MSANNILIIDDNLRQRKELEKSLQNLPLNILRTDTIGKALDILRYSNISVIILSSRLKNLNIEKFIADINHIAQSEYTHVLLLMPEKVKQAEIIDAYKKGVADYITQPIQPEIVKSMVMTFCKLYHKSKKVRELLLNILPREIADEIEYKGKVKPKRYGLATILFADFVSFTQLTKESSPVELVNKLDWYFAHFDRIITKYHLEKIKTIGDAYMCVAGVPEKRKENPVLAALAALEINNFILRQQKKLQKHGQTPWQLRIGLHTGPLVAGVIGKKKFAYDVWGDSVNIASRVCTACEPDKINISVNTYEKIKDFFDCQYRGELSVKNMNAIGMYYLSNIKAAYSINGKGKLPNKEMKRESGLIEVQYERLKEYVLNRLEKELPDNLLYHSLHHTIDVMNAVERIGKKEALNEEEQLLLNTAALLHDTGYLFTYHKNEELAIRIAKKILPDFGYTPAQIRIIAGIIRTTKIRSIPKTKLQQIMNDADYDYLGRNDYFKIARKLFEELKLQDINIDAKQWLIMQIKFIKKHKYYTQTQINERNITKQKNLHILENKLRNFNKKLNYAKN
jgi:class 3 adenylate cyclase